MGRKRAKVSRERPLSETDKRFIRYYFANGLNATDAYRRTHPRATNKTCEAEGYKVLRKPGVAGRVKKQIAKHAKRYDTSPERLMEELSAIAFSDQQDLYDDTGHIRPLSEIPESARRAISDITPRDDGKGIKSMKVVDKTKALQLLAKIQGMLTDKVEVTIDETLADRMARARKRGK